MAKYSFILLGIFMLICGGLADICCKCNKCQSYWTVCGRTCCRNGSEGCICNFCFSDKSQVASKDSDSDSTNLTQPALDRINTLFNNSRDPSIP